MTPNLPLAGVSADQQPAALWAASLVHALARDEAAGRRPARLTEPGLATWKRFRGRLAAADLVALLFEDAAVAHPVPFDASALGEPALLAPLAEALAERWLQALLDLDLRGSGADYIAGQARLLGLPTRMARSELHVVKPHQKVLELPGTGGQLAHHLLTSQADLTLHANFVVACGAWQELTLAGIVALDVGAPHTDFAVRAGPDQLRNPDHPLRRQRFDFVVGLHPSKGGLFRDEDQLAIWFSDARRLLV